MAFSGALASPLAQAYPESRKQRRWDHGVVNVLDRLAKRAQAKALLARIPCAKSRADAEKPQRTFENWCHQKGVSTATELLDAD